MDKYPKTDSEFEALFELVYKKKVDASQFNGLQKKAIYDRMRSKVMEQEFEIKVSKIL